MICQWRIYRRPRGDHPSEFLGTVRAETRDEALEAGHKAWQGKTLDAVSDVQWQAMDQRGRDFFEWTFIPPSDGSYRQISPDVRSAPCSKCRCEVFYRKQKSGLFRSPPQFCKSCDPSPYRQRLNQHSAYTTQEF